MREIFHFLVVCHLLFASCENRNYCSIDGLKAVLIDFENNPINQGKKLEPDNKEELKMYFHEIYQRVAKNGDNILFDNFRCFCKKNELHNDSDLAKVLLDILIKLQVNKEHDYESIDDNLLNRYFFTSKILVECQNFEHSQMLKNYSAFLTDKNIRVQMMAIDNINKSHAVFQICPNRDWIFDENKDIVLEGTVISRTIETDSSDAFIKLLIKNINRNSVYYFGNNFKVSDTIELCLNNSFYYEIIAD